MKKTIVVACLGILGVVIFIKSGVIESLILFLLVGAIPGTSYSVPSGIMLLIIISLLWLVIIRFTALEILLAFMDKRTKTHKPAHKKHMPKRRYSQI